MSNWEPADVPVRTEPPGVPGVPAAVPGAAPIDAPLALRIAHAASTLSGRAPALVLGAGVLGLIAALWNKDTIDWYVGSTLIVEVAALVAIVAGGVAIVGRARPASSNVPLAVAAGAVVTMTGLLMIAAIQFDLAGLVLLLAVGIGAPVVIGRDPVAQEGERDAQRIALEDPTRSVSKTHLALGVDGGGVWIEDRHSTNGVVVVRGATLSALVPGDRTPASAGDLVRFGDRWLTVESA